MGKNGNGCGDGESLERGGMGEGKVTLKKKKRKKKAFGISGCLEADGSGVFFFLLFLGINFGVF